MVKKVEAKKVEIELELLRDIYTFLCSSSKLDWEDEITSRVEETLEKGKRKK